MRAEIPRNGKDGSDAAWLALGVATEQAPGVLAKRSDWEIYVATRDGGKAIGLSTVMFGWSKLISDQEIRDAAAYVRSLAQKR